MSFVLTNTGKSILTSALSGTSITYYIAAGTNPSELDSEETDIALFSEISGRVVGTPTSITTTTTNDTLQVIGSYSPASTVLIREAALTNGLASPIVGILQPSSTVIGSISGTTVITNIPLSPTNGGYIQIRNEVMRVTAGSGTTTLTVVRAQNGTSALSDIVANDPVAQGNPPTITTVAGGSLIAKADFDLITVTEDDTINFVWEIVFL